MRHAHYSTRPHHAADRGGWFRAMLAVVLVALLGLWLVTGPAVAWLGSITDWLRGI
ncbi:MAG TPA: hypothetical protein VF143_04340 [Candidatus Nanopelagicales bacterium]